MAQSRNTPPPAPATTTSDGTVVNEPGPAKEVQESQQFTETTRTDVPVAPTLTNESLDNNAASATTLENPYVESGNYTPRAVTVDPYADGVVAPWDDPKTGYVGVDPIYQNNVGVYNEPGRTDEEKKAQEESAKVSNDTEKSDDKSDNDSK